jgi:hypothetical protein
MVSAWELRIIWSSSILFKRVPNILRHLLLARNCCVLQIGIQDISTYTSTVECIPTVVERVIAILPRYSKSDQIFLSFPGIPVFSHEKRSRTGARQSFCQLFFPTPGRRLQMNSQRIQAPSNDTITANQRCSGLAEAARRQETELITNH